MNVTALAPLVFCSRGWGQFGLILNSLLNHCSFILHVPRGPRTDPSCHFCLFSLSAGISPHICLHLPFYHLEITAVVSCSPPFAAFVLVARRIFDPVSLQESIRAQVSLLYYHLLPVIVSRYFSAATKTSKREG